MVKWFLFTTKLGDLALSLFERVTGMGLYVLPDEERPASMGLRWLGALWGLLLRR